MDRAEQASTPANNRDAHFALAHLYGLMMRATEISPLSRLATGSAGHRVTVREALRLIASHQVMLIAGSACNG